MNALYHRPADRAMPEPRALMPAQERTEIKYGGSRSRPPPWPTGRVFFAEAAKAGDVPVLHLALPMRVLAAETRLDFEVKLAPQIHVQADPVLLRTALLNLFVNAVKYNEPGGIILIDLESRENHAVLTIGNSWPGIPADDQTRIFTRFHRVDRARQRQVDGVGLGLSLAREIVRAHGGELELQESRFGWTSIVLRMKQ